MALVVRRRAVSLPAVKVVALTGGIGSGKSTVAALLAARGAVVVDADQIVRELQEPGKPVFRAMVERFGPEIVAADGTLDRPSVARIVFNDRAALADLNAIVHPAVRAELQRRVKAEAATDHVVIIDLPLLDPGSMSLPIQKVLLVDVPVETQVDRLVASRGFDAHDAWARIANQVSREQRLTSADRVIDNGGTPEELAAQVDDAWVWLQALPENS
jgi:dephospho-CoA kinase